MPRECPPAFRSARAVAGTDSAKRRSVRVPIAIAPVRCHGRCCASQEKGRCGGRADLARLTQRHNHGRPIRNQDDGAVVSTLLAILGWRQRVRGLVASRYDWLRSVEWRERPRSATVADQMALAAQLVPVGWIRSRLQPPKTARIELPSTTARDQSISPQRASQSSKEKWISCQTPASCQSRNRRQQVMPEPQPSSCGSISQGIPLRRTNRIPVRQARSGKRGLPPLGLCAEGGSSGSIRFRKSIGKQRSAHGLSILALTETAFRSCDW